MLQNEVQSSNQVSDVAAGNDEGMVSSDLLVNNLVYRTPSSLSLAVERTYVRLFPQSQTSSNGQTSVWDLTSGTSFGNCYNGYLSFDIILNATGSTGAGTSANFGCGSACNLINQNTIKSRSGTELSRVEKTNIWSRYYHVNHLPKEYLNKQGLVEGWGPNRVSASDPANVFGPSGSGGVTAAVPSKFCIPLSRLSPFWDPVKRNLKYPGQLLSGLHYEVIWEDFATALVQKSAGALGTITGYTLSNICIMMDATTMSDEVQRAINLEAAQNGLEITYHSVYTSQQTVPAGVTDLNLQLRKAVTQANYGMLVILEQAAIGDIAVDSFKAFGADVISFQYRLGSLYMPKQALRALPASVGATTAVTNQFGQSELYYTSMMTFDKFRNPFDLSAVGLTEYNTDDYTLCVSMEKDQSLQLSSLPINNSRTLETLVTFDSTSSAARGARVCYLFLDYAAVCRTFMDNASLSI